MTTPPPTIAADNAWNINSGAAKSSELAAEIDQGVRGVGSVALLLLVVSVVVAGAALIYGAAQESQKTYTEESGTVCCAPTAHCGDSQCVDNGTECNNFRVRVYHPIRSTCTNVLSSRARRSGSSVTFWRNADDATDLRLTTPDAWKWSLTGGILLLVMGVVLIDARHNSNLKRLLAVLFIVT